MSRLMLCALAAVFGGCQCFVPVDEPDAGQVDAGPADAGRDGGAITDGGCQRATDCLGPAPTTSSWCFTNPGDAGFSCLASRCVYECPMTGGRACSVDQASYCLQCGDAGTHCPATCTGGPNLTTASVENGANCGFAFTEVTITRTASAQCRYLLTGDAGQNLGELWRLDDGSYLASFPGLGGWCTGRSAFTGLPRSLFQCPACQFGLVGFE